MMEGDFKIITVSGLPGSGTSTLCRELSARLQWNHMNTGDVFRQMAEQMGISLQELGRRAESNDEIDTELDQRMIRGAKGSEGVLLEGRVTGWMALLHRLPAYRVWVDAPREVRASRVAEREDTDLDLATREMVAREQSEATRYEAAYQIDLADFSIYHLVLDSAQHNPAECADQIQVGITSRSPDGT
jgi:cytidylate kinase